MFLASWELMNKGVTRLTSQSVLEGKILNIYVLSFSKNPDVYNFPRNVIGFSEVLSSFHPPA